MSSTPPVAPPVSAPVPQPLPSRLQRAVLVDPARSRWRLVELDQRWVEHAELTAALGVDRAWRCAPAYWEAADRVVHLMEAPDGVQLPDDGWLADHELEAFSTDTLAWLRSAHASWRAGRVAVAGQPWWSADWPGTVTAWLDEVLPTVGLRRRGELFPTKLWSLSAVLRVPVDGTGGARDLWFKATCEWFRAEPALTAVVAGLAPELAPTVVAVDPERAWMLMEELVDADAEQAALGVPVAEGMSRLQLAADPDELVAAGVEVRSLHSLVGEYRDALHGSIVRDRFTEEQWAGWAAVEDWVVARIEALDALGLPMALNHGDLHLGNVAGREAPVVFDWTDACLTHPYLDARHLASEQPSEEYVESVWRAWSEPWRAAYPQVDHDLAWSLVAPVEMAFQVATYERIFRAQDTGGRGDLLSAVPWLHDRLRAAHEAAAG